MRQNKLPFSLSLKLLWGTLQWVNVDHLVKGKPWWMESGYWTASDFRQSQETVLWNTAICMCTCVYVYIYIYLFYSFNNNNHIFYCYATFNQNNFSSPTLIFIISWHERFLAIDSLVLESLTWGKKYIY